MIKITHINGDEKVVTKGAYESIFKPLGYKKVVSKEIKKEELTGRKEEESSKNEFKSDEISKRK